MSKPVQMTGDWDKLKQLSNPDSRFWQDVFDNIEKAIGEMCDQIAEKQRAKMGSGELPANSPVTIALKGQNSPLIDTGALRRSIKSGKIGKQWYAGPTGRHYSGVSAEALAAKHEVGGFMVIGGNVYLVPPRPFAKRPVEEGVAELPEQALDVIVRAFDNM